MSQRSFLPPPSFASPVSFNLSQLGYSPADENCIVSLSLFDKVSLMVNDHATFSIIKPNSRTTITSISQAGHKLDGYFMPHHELIQGGGLMITTR